MSTTLLHITDNHAGLQSGLFPPEMELVYLNDERVKKISTDWSKWVWDCYQRIISETIDFAENDPVIVIHTGDCTHGGTFAEYLYSNWESHQVAIAVRCLSELRRIPTLTGIRLCYGTAVHDYGMQAATRKVADDIAAWGYGLWAGSYGYEIIDDCQVDYAHRGPGMSHGEDRATMARKYARLIVRGLKERGKRPPDVILRGHIHTKYLSWIDVPWGKDSHMVLTSLGAPLTGPNEFSRNATRNTVYTEIGGALIRVHKGRVIDYLGRSWERENRVLVEGVVSHPFAGEVN